MDKWNYVIYTLYAVTTVCLLAAAILVWFSKEPIYYGAFVATYTLGGSSFIAGLFIKALKG